MRGINSLVICAMLCMALVANSQMLAAHFEEPLKESDNDTSFDTARHFSLRDSVLESEFQTGFTEKAEHPPLQVKKSDRAGYEYQAESPYYKVFFKGTTMRIEIGTAWILCEVKDQMLGEKQDALIATQNNELSLSNVFNETDMSYTVDTSVLTELFILKERKDIERIITILSWEGMEPGFEEDGGILFSGEDGEKIIKILSPHMEDASGSISRDLHYELIPTESGWELHKVMNEEGKKWLETAVYPVSIDPSMQTFEDAWESSGFQPYGQYFQNLQEYVCPSNGHLTITQTDLTIPGRGLDVIISRIYETPAIMYEGLPYEYEAPPVNVGRGWQLDLPYVGEKYLHLWGGTIYKMEWNNNTFENHTGSHFILEKNGDNTYTLTMADGMVHEFSASGRIVSTEDLDGNTITYIYNGGNLTSITDTIGRTIFFNYSGEYLQKVTYNGAEIQYGYDGTGRLLWMDDFLDRRTSYYYDTGYNLYLLSKIVYPTSGYTTYAYNKFSDSNYHKYYVTDQRVYETSQVRHASYVYTGSFTAITFCTMTMKNESDIIKGSYEFSVGGSDGLIYTRSIKNAPGTLLRKYTYTYSGRKETTRVDVYNDGVNLAYSVYYGYDDWGNCIYAKNPEGHEQFYSYANTSTSGFFVNNSGTVIQTFSNAFSSSSIPSTVHTTVLGTAEIQDATYVRETYLTFDSESHPVESAAHFGQYTTWLTYSGTFNEQTGQTSFPIDVSGHTVTGNAVLQVTGLASDPTYSESHSTTCPPGGSCCKWCPGYWSNSYYTGSWSCCVGFDCDTGPYSVGPFTHRPNTLGYQGYTTSPVIYGSQCSQQSYLFTVQTTWKAYPSQVQYKIDGSSYMVLSPNLQNKTVKTSLNIDSGSHTLYFSESSSYNTKFSWYLWIPVDNTMDTYVTSMTYDDYGNVISITDAESNTISLTYADTYAHAYLTEISAVVGADTITHKATYDYYRGWITSIQEPKGVDAGFGYDYLYSYDLLGRVIRKEFPLLSGQQERSYLEAIYDDTNRMVTIIDQLRHYTTRHYDKLGRLVEAKSYTGEYGSGVLYATISQSYQYDNQVISVTDAGNDTYSYTYDFLGRTTQVTYPDSSSVFYSFDDTTNKVTFINGRNYERIYWYDWLSQLIKVEEEYATDAFTTTSYQYDEIGHLLSFTDAENHATSYTYESFFGLTKTSYPDSEYETYTYDDAGNVVGFTDCNGNTTIFTYDDIHRLTEIEYTDQSTVSYTYDLNSNRIRMDDDAPNTGDHVAYTYDQWNRLTGTTRNISQNSYDISYQYDVANRITYMIYPDSMQVLYEYDDLNRTTEIKRYIDGQNDEILFSDPQYDIESLLTQFAYGNGLQAFYAFDSRDRPLTIEVKDGSTIYLDLDFTYDNNSNITQLQDQYRSTNGILSSTQTRDYVYDGLDQIIEEKEMSVPIHFYTYDKVGNRTGIDAFTYTLNSVNEVTALSDGTSFTYDDNGNRIQKSKGTDTWDYTYDYANRLIKIEKNQLTLEEYVYDGNGIRLQKTENSIKTTYIYSGINTIYEENSTGSTSYIYGPTGLLVKRTTIDQESNTYYYHKDHLGSTRSVTDNNKAVISTSTYHPFGEINDEEGSEQYLYTGKERDSTGLYYYGARYYDPEIGRFITRDRKSGRISYPLSLNKYTYCLNNPLIYIDPDGQDVFKPEWSYHDSSGSMGYSIKGIFISFLLDFQKTITKMMTGYSYWKNNNSSIEGLIGIAISLGSLIGGKIGGKILGGLIGVLALAIEVTLYLLNEAADFYYDLWCNDSTFIALYKQAETYANLFAMGADCEQEATDAHVELAIYMLQQRYGDQWRDHCPSSLLDYYDEMMKRKEEIPDQSSENSSDITHNSPPGTSIT